MIVPMRKTLLLCREADRPQALEALRDLGVIHLRPLEPLEGRDIEQAQHRLDLAQETLEQIPRPESVRGARVVAPEGTVRLAIPDEAAGDRTPEEVVAVASQLLGRKGELSDVAEALETEIQRLAPLGSFDPSARAELAEQGIHLSLWRTGLDGRPEVGEGTAVSEVGRDRSNQFWLVAGTGTPEVTDADPVAWPERSLDALRAELDANREQQREIQAQIEGLAAEREKLVAAVVRAEDDLRMIEARAGMMVEDGVAGLSGFCPQDRLDQVHAAAGQHGWAVVDQEPRDCDPVPTLLRMPAWVKPIQVVLDFINVTPGYREVDISASFLVFLTLFFAMIVGDGGYGLLFLGGALLARAKFPAMPKPLLRLLLICSTATLAWGALTGTWFGLQPEGWALIPPLREEEPVMFLCFLLGSIHLTLAHAWNALRLWPDRRVLAQVGWILTTWTMFFVARTMVLGRPFPSIMLGALGLGVVLVVVFMTPKAKLKDEWYNHVMLPLNLISNFVDVVSYVRLFAVGMATVAMAGAFNQMAAGMAGSLLGAVGALFVLLIGHGLNIALATMGVLVHGIRLNTLEFSGHLGLEWSGVRYRPFARVNGASPNSQPA